MSAITTLEKMLKALLKSHPHPIAPIQELLDNSTDSREKDEIKVMAWSWGIKLDEE